MNQFDLILWVAITMHSTTDNVMSVYQHNVVNYRDFSTFIARELTFFWFLLRTRNQEKEAVI